MDIKNKIKHIEQAGFGFGYSYCSRDYSTGAVASNLLKRNMINEQECVKLKLLATKTNFWDYYFYDKELNSQSILFINLVYKIITNK